MKTKKILFPLFAAGLLLTTGCTDNFDEYNTDPYAVKPEYMEADLAYMGGSITQMEKSIYFNANNWDWDFQIAQNLCADIFSGFMAPPTPFNGGKHNGNYFLMKGWTSYSFGMYNGGIMAPWKKVKENTLDKKEFTEVYGVALILKVMGMQRSTDCYGPIPYSKYGEGGVSVAYDSQKDIYKQFFTELDEAQKLISDFLQSDRKTAKLLKKWDLIYTSDYEAWMKLANSLRLRLAIRISKVDPAWAKTEGEKALSNAYGVIETKAQSMILPTATMKNPLNILAYAYNDIRMSADMQSILIGLKDPRIAVYFSKATDSNPEINGQYIGIRQGIDYPSKAQREKFSNLGEAWVMDKRNVTPIVLMSDAETYFLRAEALLRGWQPKNASDKVEELYKKGIEASCSYWNVSGGEYINGTTQPTAYTDPSDKKEDGTHNTRFDAQPASTVTVKWDENATQEQKLEKIITQKWIALFPEGQEAWSEFRRTGYPRLFPMVVNLSAGEIDSNIMIRRLPFNQDEYKNNKEEVEKALQLLGGPDTGGTKLWWDTNAGAADGKPNF
ncbi:SusD/RagB-like outer membrane lipoprotein [Bacteroides zoogleoformans]|uniref:SusD/RagB family nutrient-binding outer membrane lipoprotein n=1 Tax=Bacteroides zoogleoformans TaxID=28119 RepID=A0ABN5IJK5_9BACE|nr:RagB/SusD family nutrient uptake outer membrane protein [Bacteroides zoogleoformans]AVM51816.1 SusD/RagB family nutrient-binding outer membrane lipoprotein [Bacteroides zoogleoformans]TWJ13234.1 SusD/RagB-like outer membrane lipoprotein [Bacteroides zoogleoformans]